MTNKKERQKLSKLLRKGLGVPYNESWTLARKIMREGRYILLSLLYEKAEVISKERVWWSGSEEFTTIKFRLLDGSEYTYEYEWEA